MLKKLRRKEKPKRYKFLTMSEDLSPFELWQFNRYGNALEPFKSAIPDSEDFETNYFEHKTYTNESVIQAG